MIRSFLSFGNRDRLAVLTVVLLLVLAFVLPYLVGKPVMIVKPGDAITSAVSQLAENEHTTVKTENYQPYQFERSATKSYTEGALFSFDPNTISIEGWQKLGLNARLSATIVKYRKKGGKFYRTEDLMKIWGMPEGFYERIKNYVVIAGEPNTYKTNTESTWKPYVAKKPAVVSVNDADTSALIALPGIGSKLAARIINFREKLGGFYTIDQVGETYGVPDSTFQKIKPYLQIGGPVKTININQATKDQLKTHPYIRWNLANALVEYRNQHGNFSNLEELKKIVLVDDATFKKIKPYLSL
jgi:competence ComEA-like helix-hairpin-helix protein